MLFIITDTSQLLVPLAEDIPEITRFLLIGTCWPLSGDVIITVIAFEGNA
jgi:hypothetical protein